MAMTHTHQAPYPQARRKRQRRPRGLLWLPIAIFVAGVITAGSWVTYALWPRWPDADMAVDAPSLPITVNGVNFNIPPAAIVQAMIAPNGPVAPANVRGSEKMPAPIIDPMTSADKENRGNFWRSAAAPTA